MRSKGFSRDEVAEMDMAEFIARIGLLQSFENPNFNIDDFLNRESYFIGYPEEKEKYFKRHRQKGK